MEPDPWSSPWSNDPPLDAASSTGNRPRAFSGGAWGHPMREEEEGVEEVGWGGAAGGGWGASIEEEGWGAPVSTTLTTALDATMALAPEDLDEIEEPTRDVLQASHQRTQPADDLGALQETSLEKHSRSSSPSPAEVSLPLSPTPGASSPSSPPRAFMLPPSPPPPPTSPEPFTASPLPNTFPMSPSGDFGTFASSSAHALPDDEDDPWGTPFSGRKPDGEADGDDGWEEPVSVSLATINHDDDEDDAWGKPASARESDKPNVDEWEAARQLATRKEARAPTHVIAALSREWLALAKAAYPDPSPTSDDVAASSSSLKSASLDTPPNEVDAELALSLEKLTSVCRAELIAPPPSAFTKSFKESTTAQRFQSAISRTSAFSSSSSFLAANPHRRARERMASSAENDNLGAATSDGWSINRSYLGEPEAELDTAASTESFDDAPARGGLLGFFGRKGSQGSISTGSSKPGIPSRLSSLESLPVVAAALTEKVAAEKAAAGMVSPISPMTLTSERPSTSSARASLEVSTIASASGSRSASPAPGLPAAPSAALAVPDHLQASAPSAPSGVSRFFGRFGRKSTPVVAAAPAGSAPAASKQSDLQLSAGDFGFLEEVEGTSSTPSGADDDFFSFTESPLEAAKPMPLPKPLAPPPSSSGLRSTMPSSSREPLSVAPARKSSAMSELDFLDFGPSSSTSIVPAPSSSSAASTASSPLVTAFDAWDDFMTAPTSPMAVPSILAASASRISTPPILSSPVAAAPAPAQSSPLAHSFAPLPTFISSPLATERPSSAAPPSSISIDPLAKSATANDANNDFGDFGSFEPFQATPVAASSSAFPAPSSFDDFDDFTAAPPTLSAASSAGPSDFSVLPKTNPPGSSNSRLSMPSINGFPDISSSPSPSRSPHPPMPPTKSPRHRQTASTAVSTPGAIHTFSSTPISPFPSRRPNAAGVESAVREMDSWHQAAATPSPPLPPPAPAALPKPLAPPPGWSGGGGKKIDFFGDDDNDKALTSPVVGSGLTATPRTSTPMLSAPTPSSTTFESKKAGGAAASARDRGGGLSGADLDFFDSL